MSNDSSSEAQLKTLMKLSLIFDTAGEVLLGKGAPAMMYQAGRDAGCAKPDTLGRAGDEEEALQLALNEGGEVWQVERWREPGRDGLWIEDGDRRYTWVIFRRCPLMSLARCAGSSLGGMLCQALHGYIAGSMESMLGRRADMKVGHCGPRACKILLELRP